MTWASPASRPASPIPPFYTKSSIASVFPTSSSTTEVTAAPTFVTTFEVLFPLLADRGLYVIEDLHCSYRTDYGGGPAGTDGRSVEYVKGLLDDVVRQRSNNSSVAGVHVYPRIVFIEKQ